MIINFFFSFFTLNLIVFTVLFVYGDFKLLLNVEVGAVGSVLTTLGSYFGYKKMVEKKSKDYVVEDEEDETDELERIEDPHGLYDEKEVKEDDNLDIKEVIKEERSKMKTNWSEIIGTFKGGVSFFRILGYIFIIYSFFFLLERDILHPVGFILGLSLVPITVILRTKKIL